MTRKRINKSIAYLEKSKRSYYFIPYIIFAASCKTINPNTAADNLDSAASIQIRMTGKKKKKRKKYICTPQSFKRERKTTHNTIFIFCINKKK